MMAGLLVKRIREWKLYQLVEHGGRGVGEIGDKRGRERGI
jgi:hypothetical protein